VHLFGSLHAVTSRRPFRFDNYSDYIVRADNQRTNIFHLKPYFVIGFEKVSVNHTLQLHGSKVLLSIFGLCVFHAAGVARHSLIPLIAHFGL
jgi:hypothetical protein